MLRLFPYGGKKLWKPTSFWLYDVAVGGGYRRFCDGIWVKVGTRPRPKRRKKSRLKFGELSHILRVKKIERDSIEIKIGDIEDILSQKRCDICEYGECAGSRCEKDFDFVGKNFLMEKKNILEEKLDMANHAISGVFEEMKVVYKKKIVARQS